MAPPAALCGAGLVAGLRSASGAPFTTVTNWIMYDYWVDDEQGGYANDKRTGFLPFLDLPRHTSQPLELALSLGGAETERADLEQRGWRVREAHEIVATPDDYQRYIQSSRGEFSCAKPSCVRLQNAWVSDRTLCYLASGKPAVVQHTGKSRFLPDAEGLFRFSTIDKPPNNWRPSQRTTTINPSSPDRSPKSTSTLGR